jgi:hypothetical protein
MLLPREHGAWGLLLQPFVCAAILARRWQWTLLAAAGLALVGFIIREPLVVLARQKWVWREKKPETEAAWRCLAWQIPAALSLWTLLAWRVPAAPLAWLSGAALAVTAIAVWMTVKNRQRSVSLQVASSIGLGATAPLAALAATGGIPAWAWWLWGLLSVHGACSILVVRARLEARAGAGLTMWRRAAGALAAAGATALAMTMMGKAGAGAALGFSAAVGFWELAKMRRTEGLTEPLKRVGWRTLGASLTQGAIAVAALYS